MGHAKSIQHRARKLGCWRFVIGIEPYIYERDKARHEINVNDKKKF